MKIVIALLLAIISTGAAAQSSCVPSPTSACLIQDRFEVTVEFDTANAAFVPSAVGSVSGDAEVSFIPNVPSAESSAAFSFYDAEQMDVVVTILDGCQISGRFWVFAAGATDSEVRISVTDTQTGAAVEYFSPGGQDFTPVADTNALDVCPGAAAPAQPAMADGGSPDSARGSCGATFCLQNDRFALDVAWTQPTMSGQFTNAASVDHSGLGWAFQPEFLNLLSTVIDGRADSDAFWFLTSETTGSELVYTLTDTDTGLINTYFQQLGVSSTLLDRGQPIEPELSELGNRGASAGTVSFELLLTNTAPAEREFTAVIPTPSGATNPSFTCSASAGAQCPALAGSGVFEAAGPLVPGGRLSFIYSVDLATASGPGLQVDASIETAAHALSDAAVTRNVSVTGIARAPVSIPVDSRWAIAALAIALMLITVTRLGGRN